MVHAETKTGIEILGHQARDGIRQGIGLGALVGVFQAVGGPHNRVDAIGVVVELQLPIGDVGIFDVVGVEVAGRVSRTVFILSVGGFKIAIAGNGGH